MKRLQPRVAVMKLKRGRAAVVAADGAGAARLGDENALDPAPVLGHALGPAEGTPVGPAVLENVAGQAVLAALQLHLPLAAREGVGGAGAVAALARLQPISPQAA